MLNHLSAAASSYTTTTPNFPIELNSRMARLATSVDARLSKTIRRPGTRGDLGYLYEQALLMLGLYRMLQSGSSFRLDTNVLGDVGDFDDVVLTCGDHTVYLQAKHAEDRKKRISYGDLLNRKGNYSLYKYFKSYLEIMSNSNKKEHATDYFIIYTNIDFQDSGKRSGEGGRILRGGRGFQVADQPDIAFKPIEDLPVLCRTFRIDAKGKRKWPAFYRFDGEKDQDGLFMQSLIKEFQSFFQKGEARDKSMLASVMGDKDKLAPTITDYLNRLIFAVDQPNVAGLVSQIKNEIKQGSLLSADLSQEQNETIFNYVRYRISEWKNRSKEFPLSERDDYFKEAEKNLDSLYALNLTIDEEERFSQVPLNIRPRGELKDFLASGHKVLHMIAETPYLSSVLLYQMLLKSDKAGLDHHLFLSSHTFCQAYTRLLPAWEKGGRDLLILYDDPKQGQVTIREEAWQALVEPLKKVLDREENKKKILLIMPNENSLVQGLKRAFPIYCQERTVTVHFSDLTEASQIHCLQAAKFRFQANAKPFSLNQLWGLHLSETKYLPCVLEAQLEQAKERSQLVQFLETLVIELDGQQVVLPITLQRLRETLIFYWHDVYIVSEAIKDTLIPKLVTFLGNLASERRKEEASTSHYLPSYSPEQQKPCPLQSQQRLTMQLMQGLRDITVSLNQILDTAGLAIFLTEPIIDLGVQLSSDQQRQNLVSDLYIPRDIYPIRLEKGRVEKWLAQEEAVFDFVVFQGITLSDLFTLLHVEGKKQDFFKKTSFASLDKELAERVFKDPKHPRVEGMGVHQLIVSEEKELHWLRSEGDMQRLREAVCVDDELLSFTATSLSEADLVARQERVLVLADEPGMGKSTSLRQMGEQVRAKQPMAWVFPIDLNQHQVRLSSEETINTILSQIYNVCSMESPYSPTFSGARPKRSSGSFSQNAWSECFTSVDINKKQLLDLIVCLLSEIDSTLKKPLARSFFTYYLNCPDRVVFLLDGFDEVKPERQEGVLRLLQLFRQWTAAKLWITTRQYSQPLLEDGFSVLSYSFRPLTDLQQIDFLRQFWCARMDVSDSQQLIVKAYAGEVVRSFDASIQSVTTENQESFLRTPLQGRMLAEVFQKRVRYALRQERTHLLQADERLPIRDLYQQFVEKQYTSYLREKVVLNEGVLDNELRDCLFSAYDKSHGQFALQAFFGTDKTASLIANKKEKFSLPTLWGVGLLQKGEKDQARFVHRTFTEYFVAKYVSSHLKKDQVLKDFWEAHLFNAECQTIRYFVDEFLSKELRLHSVVLQGKKGLCSILLQEGFHTDQVDDLGRTSLHLALIEGHEALVDLLYEDSNERLEADDFGRTPLHYAARYGHAILLERCLLCPHIDIDLDDHLFRTPLHVDSEIGQRLFRDSADMQASQLIPLVDAPDRQGYSPLYYAGVNGHWEAACVLLLHGADSGALREADKKKLLDYAAKMTHERYANQYHPLRPVVGFLATQVPEAVCGYFEGYNYPRLLSYFFAYGHTQVIDILLTSLEPDKRKRVANEGDNNYAPLRRMIENYCFRDADHLKILQYLFYRGVQQGIVMNPKNTANTVLQVAAACGNLKTFRYLIEQREARVDYSDYGNFTMVDRAIVDRNNLNILAYLWENHREDINDSLNRTPLHIAACSANLRAAQYLCAHGAEVNSSDSQGMTPLHYAGQAPWIQMSPVDRFIGKDHFLLLNYLVSEKKANVAISNRQGKTVLDLAMENQCWESAAYLIKRCVPLGIRLDSPGDRSKAFIAIFFRDPSGFDRELVDKTGLPRLHQAIRSGETLWARFLIQQGVLINRQDRYGRTPLHWVTVFQKNTEICKLLLQRGVIYNPCDLSDKTPLDYLRVLANGAPFPLLSSAWLLERIDSLFHSQNLMQDLKESILNERSEGGMWLPDVYDEDNPMLLFLTVRNREGKTLVHRAADTGDSKAVKCLLRFNQDYLKLKGRNNPHYAYVSDYIAMDLDIQDEVGNTPLHYAAQKGHSQIVDILLEAGAIFNVKNRAGQTPQCLAQENQQHAMVEILAGIADRFAAIKAAGVNVLALMQQASSKVVVSARDHEGKTLLHWAARKGQLSVMQYLLGQAIEKDAVDKQHNTPLHEAAIHGQQEAVFYLLRRGAAFDIRNKENKTPLDSVQHQKQLKMRVLQGVKRLFKDIRVAGPDVVLSDLKHLANCPQDELNAILHARDSNGDTLLHWAAQADYLSVVQFLLERGACYDLRNKQRKTPLDLAHRRDVTDLLVLVKEWMENKTPFTFRLKGKEDTLFKEIPPFSLTEVASDPGKLAVLKNARDTKGNTLLHGNTNYFRLKFLIAQAADCTARNQEDETPLQIATRQGDKKAVRFFKEAAARRAEDEDKESLKKPCLLI